MKSDAAESPSVKIREQLEFARLEWFAGWYFSIQIFFLTTDLFCIKFSNKGRSVFLI